MGIRSRSPAATALVIVTASLPAMIGGCASWGASLEGSGPSEGIVRGSGVDSPARLLTCVGYEPASRASSNVVVRASVVVNSEGTVEQVLIPGRINPTYRVRATELALRCLFEPARTADQPVAVRYELLFLLPPLVLLTPTSYF